MGNEDSNPNYIRTPIIQSQNQFKPMIITTTKVDYFKGESVEGNIILNNQLPIVLTDIYINLYLLESWIYQETSSQSYGEMNNQPLLCVQVGINKILNIDTELINLSAGYFNFPFKFQLPNYLQPCFEYPLPEKRGYLRYSLESKFISPYVQGSTSTYIIVKSRPNVLNSPLSFSSVMNVHKWGLIDQGTTQLKVSYLTNNFRINDNVNLKVEINNTRGKLKVSNCEINVVRKVGYRKKNTDKNQYYMENIIVNKNYDINVEPMNQKTFNYTIELKDKNKNNFNYLDVQNPYPNLIDISYAMPTTDGTIIKCDYCIIVTLYFYSFVTSGYLPKVTLPISLTHQTQDEYNLERQEDEDLKRAIEASKLEMNNKNYKDDFDLIDEENYKNVNEKNNNDFNKNINMSVVDKNKMYDSIDKPNRNDMEKMQPISQSQIIDNDNNNLPSKNEIENINKNKIKNNENNNNYNINQNYMKINQNNNKNINQNNYGNNNMFMNPNNYENEINNNLQNCPAPVWVNKKDDEDDLFNPYMKSSISENKNKNNSNIQMSNVVNRNFSNYNNFNNPSNQNNNNINQINNNNLNINNNYPNYNNRENENRNNNQMNKEMNNNYPDFYNYSNVNDNNNINKININENNNSTNNKNKEESFKTINEGNDFNLLKENNNESEEKIDNDQKYYNINEL